MTENLSEAEKSSFKLPIAPLSKHDSPKVENKPVEAAEKAEQKLEVLGEHKTRKSPAEILKERSEPPLQYSEPEWGGMPPNDKKYYIEELKNGTIVKTHNLTGKHYYVVGRLPSNDIQLEHPSLSRFHAVLQFKSEGSTDQPIGFYLYDLDSTHGTYHNKNRCFSKTYYRLRVGHGLKFGGSTRLLILQGPDEDMEEESDLTVTELKEMAAEKARLKRVQKLEQEKGTDHVEEESSNDGISWGMADDAAEEDEQNPDMSKNPFALEPQHEELYLDDPKKTLKCWFEREGFELEYKCVEKGYATFTCSIELPINEVLGSGGGGPTIAEATVKGGKKKEAIVQAALEACRMLDRFNLLRQSNQESKAKKQMKKWKEDDYYDSDEDEFLDRTGTIEAKRKKRMQMELMEDDKAAPPPVVDTYDTLKEKYANMERSIVETEKSIAEAVQALNETKKLQKSDTDDLDAFMDSLKKTEKAHGGKEHVSKLKQLLLTQQNELKRLEKLVNIAKPTQMPKLQPLSKSNMKGVMIGKRFGLGGAKNLRTISQPMKPRIQEDSLKIEEPPMPDIASPVPGVSLITDTEKNETTPENQPAPVKGPKLPSDHENEEDIDEPAKKKRKRPKHKRRPHDDSKDEEAIPDDIKVPGDYDTSDPKYATWLPPQNQSGDGRTSLNDKYGY